MTHTEITNAARLISQIEAYLKPTTERQYAVVVSKRFLVKLLAELKAYDEQRIREVEQTSVGDGQIERVD